eukprot:TRINITY_DN72712_c0_g1_i1.p1 TRINITY_DN72712_c0_g1~~TRINITY_DN72712_c0_g1_i1.p1  ORF type:complete len:516 (-),score=116.12 TRINITY_DN72712_c0_g1_i1:260-1771(-)
MPKHVSEPDAEIRQSSAVSGACPAFAEGCPYASDDKVVEWIKQKRPDAISTCPAFKEGCPFNEASDMDSLRKQLEALPASHAGMPQDDSSKPHHALMDMLKAVHQASQTVKQSVGGDCPVFQEACPFKNCVTSSGTPLALELETRSWGLWIHETAGEAQQTAEESVQAEAGNANSTTQAADGEGLAKKLKEGTKEAHKAAETVHFVREFIKGRVSREIYAQFVVNLFHVYKALEEGLELCAEHPLVESLHFPEELERADALKQDAAYFFGTDWERQTLPSKVTREYVERLRKVAKESPELLVPHAYTRYLGDLSGGQVLRRAAIRGLKLPADGSGVNFYTFKRIRDAKVFKNMYRARMDSLAADSATADRMVVEANYAFSLNTRIFQELDSLAGFEAEPALPPNTVPAPLANNAAAQAAAAGCPFANLAASGIAMPDGHPPMHAEKAKQTKMSSTLTSSSAPEASLKRQATVRHVWLLSVFAVLLLSLILGCFSKTFAQLSPS